jgi:thiosulfate reductase cytochrome b subunit
VPSSSFSISPLVIARRWRRPTGKTGERAEEREIESTKVEVFEHTTSAAVGRPDEGQRGYFGLGKKGRSMPLNPLLVLNKVSDPATKKVLLAVRKLKNNPETMQLSENEQQHVVNAFASTKWYSRLWSPMQSLNYKSLRRWNYFCAFIFTICFIGIFMCIIVLYRNELVAFQCLSEEEQAAYHAIVMHVRYSEIHHFAVKVLKDSDPFQILPHEARLQLVVTEMMKAGWHMRDWTEFRREQYKTTPWKDKDWIHMAFWAIMYFGRSCTGSSTFYTASFGDVEERVRANKNKAADDMRSHVVHGPQPSPSSIVAAPPPKAVPG